MRHFHWVRPVCTRFKTLLVSALVAFGFLPARGGSELYTNEVDFVTAIGVSQQFLNDFADLAESEQYAHPLSYSSNGFRYELTSTPMFEIWSLTGAVSVVESTDEIVVSVTTSNTRALGGWIYLTDNQGNPTNGTVRAMLSDGTTNRLEVGNAPMPFTGFISGGDLYRWLRLRSESPGAFATLDHFYAAEGVPALTINFTSANDVLIAWPAPATGYVLESNDDLTATNWTEVFPKPQLVGGQLQVATSSDPTNRFYRLIRLP